MAHIRMLSQCSFRAEIRKNNAFIQSKTFPTKKQAITWSDHVEVNIETILSLKPKQVKKITPRKAELLGGQALFKKLGVDLSIISFAMLADEYMQQWTGKDKNQINRAQYWSEIFGDLPIKSITRKRVKKAIDKFANSGAFLTDGSGRQSRKKRCSNTVLRYKCVLSGIFKYAIQQFYIKKNPVEGVYVKVTSNIIERYLSEQERQALLQACRQSSWDRLYLLVVMAITTGMRKSEMMHLRWSDIDFDRSLARLADTKNGSPRHNPIPAPAMQELKKFHTSGNDYIFSSPYKPSVPFEFTKRWKAALTLAGIENFRFHDLRHTAASYLVMAGATLHETAEILGHKSTETTKRYAHLSTHHKSALAERVMGNIFNH